MTYSETARVVMAAVLGLVAALGNLLGGYFVVRRDLPRAFLHILFVAVFLHKLPEGFTIASVVLASGQSRNKAILSAGALGAATLLGVLLTSLLQGQLRYALPLSAGVTVYVAATDLLPEVNREPGWRTALLVFVGVASLLIMQRLFHV